MSDHAQFEAMLEALINEDQETAKEIFHNIVVGKSREIYEELLESDFSFGEEDDDTEESEDESEDGEFGQDDEESDEEGDDFASEFDTDEDEEEEGDLEDRVVDLEDELESLRAEFEELLHDEESEEDEYPGIHGDEETDDLGDMEADDEFGAEEPSPESDEEFQKFMEYVTKVNKPTLGDDGVNTTSVFNKDKYADMGGTTANITRGGTADSKGTKGGLLDPTTKPVSTEKYQNTPGGNAGKTAFKTQVKAGHGSERKGAGETQVNTKSPLKGR
jgi:hypothetical protein